MVDRSRVEQMLRVNGVPTTAPDEVIKSVLLNARWQEDDIEAAVVVLRENKDTHEQKVDTVHKIFRSDDALPSDQVSMLLGIDMDIKPGDIQLNQKKPRISFFSLQMLFMIIVTTVLTAGLLLAAMWHFEMGFFHPTLG